MKSPVRENRTQGSVQGTPGNRRSYCDAPKLIIVGALNKHRANRKNHELSESPLSVNDGGNSKGM